MSKKIEKTTRKTPRTATALSAKAEEIMAYALEGLIHEVQPLFTALYLSCPQEADRLRKTYPNSSEICNLVNDVIKYHTDVDHLKKIVTKGFFECELRCLLQLGMDVPIAGTRLSPIFHTALEHTEELGLSDDLQDDVKQYLEICKVRDGFLIISADSENIVLDFAKDVIAA